MNLNVEKHMLRLLGSLLACTLLLQSSLAWSDEPSLKIGVLEDMSGPYADVTGLGSVIAARMAVEDFGPVLGRKVEIISADHLNKADNGVAIAKRWIDVDGIEMITGLGNTAVGLAVRGLASSTGKVDINTASGSSDLTGKACSATGFHWVYDTFALAKTVGTTTIRSGAETYFIVAADYSFGTAMSRAAARFADAVGGKSVGTVRVPLNTPDFSSFILQAQASKAKAIMLAIAGTDLI